MTQERLKYRYRIIDQRAGDDQPPLMAVSIHHGVVPRESLTDDLPRAEDLSNYKVCERGDIVLNRMRAFQGAIGLSHQRGIVSPDYLVLRPSSNTDPRYLHHLFRSSWFVGEMVSRLRGIGNTENGSVRTPRINPEDFGEIVVDFPSFEVQRRIADFLDAETARIDQLAMLQRAVLSSVEARTLAQLDLKVDELTAEYGALPFRRRIWSIEQGVSPQCDNFPAGPDDWGVLKVSAVKNGGFFEDENKQLPTHFEPDPRYEIKDGDLLVTRANTPKLVGAATVADSPRPKLMLCDKIFRIKATSELLPKFLLLVSLGTRIRDMCAEASHGTSQSMANLKTEEIKRWPIPAAPVPIQRTAIKELSAAIDHADELTSAIDKQLALLAERKQALITAAVTGQIDVTTARHGIAEVALCPLQDSAARHQRQSTGLASR